jgi:nitroimidazol reductase NimA-like FMN-containing flavoprotein (pyridoxamine 5'-phosphate oxidase superfamily)
MRCRKREVLDRDEVFGILARCKTVRIGMFGDRYPYVVPVSFGMEVVDGKCAIYFHCGKKGMKVELLKANPNVCIEADVHYAYELLKRGIDTRYESVVGFGTCTEVEGDEKLHGLELLCEHCGYAGHPVDVCLGLPITSVYKVEIDEITGKRTLPEYWKQSGSGTPCLDE